MISRKGGINSKMRIQIPARHYDSQHIKNFLDELQEKIEQHNCEFGTVNIYVSIKNEDGENVDMIKDDKVINYKAKFIKNENNEKESQFIEWLK